MAIRLINIYKFVPGGYSYQQTGDKPHFFKAESYSLREQASIVLQYRTANKLPRASLHETMEDIDDYTCRRLGAHTRWCRDTDKSYAAHHPQTVKTRQGCGYC